MEMEKPAVKCPFLLRSKTERFYIDGFSRAFFAITRFLNLLKANVDTNHTKTSPTLIKAHSTLHKEAATL
jgi:hypothetical protein